MGAVKPKKFLGQHFLKDLDIARRIADTLDDFTDVPVIEVGPGMGVLTQFLIEKEKDLTVVEIDRDSVPYLNEHYPALHGRIVEGDFLTLDLSAIYSDKFCQSSGVVNYLDIQEGRSRRSKTTRCANA